MDAGSTGFDGYLDYSGTGLVNELSYFNPPLGDDVAMPPAGYNFYLNDAAGYAAQLPSNVTIDAGKAIVWFGASDCGGFTAAHLTVETSSSDASTVVRYGDYAGGLDNASLTATTGAAGGRILNVPGTTTVLTLTDPAGPTTVGTKSVVLRPGAFTEVALVPSP